MRYYYYVLISDGRCGEAVYFLDRCYKEGDAQADAGW